MIGNNVCRGESQIRPSQSLCYELRMSRIFGQSLDS